VRDIKEILLLSEEYLKKHKIESPKVKAEWLISHCLELKRLDLYMQHDRPLNDNELDKIRQLLKRCASNEPVQYICGSTSFYGYDIKVGPGVLIPRPETEVLVDLALKEVKDGDHLLDLCTGSACIPIAIQKERSNSLNVIACDIEKKAIKYATENIVNNNLQNTKIINCDLFEKIPKIEFDLITANPPYVSRSEYSEMGIDVLKHEPETALFAQNEGMEIIIEIAEEAKNFMKANANILIEIGAHQGEKCIQLFKKMGYINVEVVKDYSQRDRILRAQRHP
jgi:release factor glutamine methyltransferase